MRHDGAHVGFPEHVCIYIQISVCFGPTVHVLYSSNFSHLVI